MTMPPYNGPKGHPVPPSKPDSKKDTSGVSTQSATAEVVFPPHLGYSADACTVTA
jgi:hypothetical protein